MWVLISLQASGAKENSFSLCLQSTFICISSYRACSILVLYLEEVHRSDHGLHGHEDVLVDQLDVGPLVIIIEAGSVDDSHLLDEG